MHFKPAFRVQLVYDGSSTRLENIDEHPKGVSSSTKMETMRDIFGTHEGETFSAGLIDEKNEAVFDVNLDLVCISDGKRLSQVLLMWICPRFSQMVCGKTSRCFLSVV